MLKNTVSRFSQKYESAANQIRLISEGSRLE